MVQRIVKMIGVAYSTDGDVQVRATYNGSEIANGPVPTTIVDAIPLTGDLPSSADTELVLFETTTDITGQIPVTISVTGGTLYFRHFWMNYTGYETQVQRSDPNVPIDLRDASTFIRVVTVQPDSYYADPNTNTLESDGILNLNKNDQPWVWRTNVDPQQLGDWIYPIRNGDNVTFDFFVDPAKVILAAPTD